MGARRGQGPAPDVFETFADQVDEDGDSAQEYALDIARVVRSAGATLVVMVLAAVAFVLGFWWGAAHEPDLVYDQILWEGVIKVGWATLWGALASGAAVAVAALLVGVPWALRQRARERGAERAR